MTEYKNSTPTVDTKKSNTLKSRNIKKAALEDLQEGKEIAADG